jgi:polysaccharide pyruvyl transferase WcaK-like protein
MFTQAIFRQLVGEVNQIGFSPDPDVVNADYDFVVIPAANWLGIDASWDWLCDIVEKITIPIVTVGIGIQEAKDISLEAVAVSKSAIRLIKILSDKSHSISVRGDFTKEWLGKIGIRNTVTTGCPSLYMDIAYDTKEYKRKTGVIQSTAYELTGAFVNGYDTNRQLFEAAARTDSYMIYQSEPFEMRQLIYGNGFDKFDKSYLDLLLKLYGFPDIGPLRHYIENRGRVFFNIEEWSNFLRRRTGLIGTRLHGTIIALNSGTPAVLLSHDARTMEMISFAKIPTSNNLEDLLHRIAAGNAICSEVDYQTYLSQRLLNSLIYKKFLDDNGLESNVAL